MELPAVWHILKKKTVLSLQNMFRVNNIHRQLPMQMNG